APSPPGAGPSCASGCSRAAASLPRPMVDEPLISILVPAFNEARTLEGVLRRVAELPLRTEIVVVDDGSTDATPEILERLGGEIGSLRSARQANAGKGAAVRKAIALSNGDFVVVQ